MIDITLWTHNKKPIYFRTYFVMLIYMYMDLMCNGDCISHLYNYSQLLFCICHNKILKSILFYSCLRPNSTPGEFTKPGESQPSGETSSIHVSMLNLCKTNSKQ